MSDKKEEASAEITMGRAVRQACIQAAREGFRDASMSGLCTEGAIEAAVGAMQSLDIEKVVAEVRQIGQ